MASSTGDALKQRVAQNTSQTCNAPGCYSMRVSVGHHCRYHQDRRRRYGDATGQPLKPALWKPYRDSVAALFEANSSHPGLVLATEHIKVWMTRASASDRAFNGAEEIARLVGHGITPLQLLTTVCAVWVCLQQCPRIVGSDSNRAHEYAVARAVFGLVPRPRSKPGGLSLRRTARGVEGFPSKGGSRTWIKTSALGHVGAYLRTSLSLLLANVQTAVENKQRAEQASQEALRKPFDIAPAIPA